MKKKIITLLLIVSGFVSLNAQSDSSRLDILLEMSLEELMELEVLTSVGKNQGIFRTNSSVTIIDKQMISTYNFQTIEEALQTVAGFSVYRTYLKRNIPTSRGILQDHYANKVLVLINGIEAWHAVTGEGNLSRININDVERIEVQKGPASGKYGTNAYSGVVNIILKSNNAQKANFHIGGGSSLLGKAGGNIIFEKGEFNMFISANYQYEKGYTYSFTDETDSTGNINEYMNIANFTTYLNYKSHHLFLNAFDTDESYLGVAPKFTLGAGNNHDVMGAIANYKYDNTFFKKLDLKFTTSFDWNKRNLSRSADNEIRANIEGYRVFSKLCFAYNFSDNFTVMAGTDINYLKSIEYKNYNQITNELITKEFANMTLTGNNGMKNLILTENTFFAGFVINKNKIGIDALFRYMHNNKFNTENIFGNATFVYKLNQTNSIKLITGRSYRNPSFFEKNFLYSTVLGNSNLKPEIANSVEIAYLTKISDFFVQTLFYYSSYNNKIFRVKGDTLINNTLVQDINIYHNAATFTAKGIEFELQYRNPKIMSAFFNFNYVLGDDGDKINDKYNFNFVPQYAFSVGLSKRISNFIISSNADYMSSVNGFDSKIEQQYMVNLNLIYIQKLNKITLKHSIFAKNILNSMYFYPEYARTKVINQVPYGYGRFFGYTLNIILK